MSAQPRFVGLCDDLLSERRVGDQKGFQQAGFGRGWQQASSSGVGARLASE